MPAPVSVLHVQMMNAMGCVGTDVNVGVMCVVTAVGTKVVLVMIHAAELRFIKSVVWFLIIFTVINLIRAKSY